MSELGKRLIASAKQARRIARGEADAASYRVHIPAKVEVAAIRKRPKLSRTAPATLKDRE